MAADRSLRRLISNTGVYGASVIASRVGWFFLLPIYWAYLSPQDFGIIGIALVVQVFLLPALSLGLHDTILRFYLEWRPEERPGHVAGMWVLAIAWSTGLALALLVAGRSLFARIFEQVPFDPYLSIAVATAFFTSLGTFPLSIMRIKEERRRYSLATLGLFAAQASFVLFLVVRAELGVTGYLLGMMLAAASWAACLLWVMRAEIGLPIRWARLEAPLRYALPTIPVAMLEGASSLLDRYVLDKYAGIGQIGLYNLANTFGQAFNSFNQILKISWFPFLYKVVSETDQGPQVLGRYSVYYLAFLALPALGVALLAKEYVDAFGDARYQGLYPLVPWFVLMYYILSVATAMGRGLDLAKKTGYWMAIPVVGITASVALLVLLVPRFGVWGAITAAILAAAARTAVQLWLSHRFYPRPVYWMPLAGIACAGAATFAIGCHVDTGSVILNAVLKTAVIAAGGAVILGFASLARPTAQPAPTP